MIILHDEAYYESRKPQPDLGPLQNFKRFVWNKEKRAFLTRTASEWAQLGIFYVCFFGVLGSIFALQMYLSIRAVSHMDKPYFQHSSLARAFFEDNFPIFRTSLNFGSPGIGFKPNILSPTTSPIIWVNDTKTNSRSKRYIDSLVEFLREYKKNASNYETNCTEGNFMLNSGKPCFFDIKSLGPCSEPPYGYSDPFQPCVFLKFNKRFHWIPLYYNESSELPEKMPRFLKKIVRTSTQNSVWLSCEGAFNVDKDHIGKIEYNPGPGFPIQYFPFTGHPDYLSPIVALQLKNLTPNRLVTVECNLWAHNIRQSSHYALDFQIIIEILTVSITYYRQVIETKCILRPV